MRALMPALQPSVVGATMPETVRDLGLSLPGRADISGLWLARNSFEDSIGNTFNPDIQDDSLIFYTTLEFYEDGVIA